MPAERLRSRIVKYQGQLFTFLDHDGVSWNNTNAEHFIKAFARYRRTANGIFTARSIKEYLVILSIAETSKARGEDFLKFLLRDNKDSHSFNSIRRVSAITASDVLSAPPSRSKASFQRRSARAIFRTVVGWAGAPVTGFIIGCSSPLKRSILANEPQMSASDWQSPALI